MNGGNQIGFATCPELQNDQEASAGSTGTALHVAVRRFLPGARAGWVLKTSVPKPMYLDLMVRGRAYLHNDEAGAVAIGIYRADIGEIVS